MRRTVRDLRTFWNEAARENALWYVDTSLSFEEPDHRTFLSNGRRIAEACLAHFRPDSARHVALDIGCGLGRVIDELAPRFSYVVGLDVSSEMLRRAATSTHSHNRGFVLSDGSGLGCVRTGSVDLAVSFAVFSHLPAARLTRSYIEEIERVLRPGGGAAFHVNTSSGSWWWAARRWGLSILSLAAPSRRRVWSRSFQGSSMSMRPLLGCVKRTGLELVEVRLPRSLFTMVYVRKPGGVRE